jgi:hypothetical protein
VWPGISVSDDSLIQCIRDIRIALEDDARELVKTIVGRGYILKAQKKPMAVTHLPVIYVESFDVTVSKPLSDELFEALLFRLTARAGASVIVDSNQKTNATYLVSGKVTCAEDTARIFLQIGRNAANEIVHSDIKSASGGQIRDLPDAVAEAVAARVRVHMIINDG